MPAARRRLVAARAALGALALLAACGSTANLEPAYAARFVGKPVNEVIAKLGPPERRAPEGAGEMLVWEEADTYEARVPNYSSIGTSGQNLRVIDGYRTRTLLMSCAYEVTTNAAGIVVAQRLEGDGLLCRRMIAGIEVE